MESLKNIHELTAVLDKVRQFTMVAEASLVDLALQVKYLLVSNIPGDFVECGVWRGGAAFLMAELLRQAGVTDRKVWLFDSFEGLPSAGCNRRPSRHGVRQEHKQSLVL